LKADPDCGFPIGFNYRVFKPIDVLQRVKEAQLEKLLERMNRFISLQAVYLTIGNQPELQEMLQLENIKEQDFFCIL